MDLLKRSMDLSKPCIWEPAILRDEPPGEDAKDCDGSKYNRGVCRTLAIVVNTLVGDPDN